MRKEVANELYALVNTKANMDALNLYVNLRIDFLKDELASATAWDTVQKFQGAIEELKRFSKLRDEVNNPRD